MLGFCTNKSNICISFVPELIEAEPNQILLYKLMVLSDAKIMTFFALFFVSSQSRKKKKYCTLYFFFAAIIFIISMCQKLCDGTYATLLYCNRNPTQSITTHTSPAQYLLKCFVWSNTETLEKYNVLQKLKIKHTFKIKLIAAFSTEQHGNEYVC